MNNFNDTYNETVSALKAVENEERAQDLIAYLAENDKDNENMREIIAFNSLTESLPSLLSENQ